MLSSHGGGRSPPATARFWRPLRAVARRATRVSGTCSTDSSSRSSGRSANSSRAWGKGVTARRPVFRPIHRALGLDGYPEADRLWTRCLSLPCYPSLADAEVEAVGAALAEALHA